MLLGLSCRLMFTLYQMDAKGASLNSYLNVDGNQDDTYILYDMLVTEFPTHRKDGNVVPVNSEVNDVVNNVNENIDDVVNDSFSVDEGYIHKNNEAHVGSALINQGVTKDVGLSKKSDKK